MIIIGNFAISPDSIFSKIFSTLVLFFTNLILSFFDLYSAISFPTESESTTTKSSPARGMPSNPSISIGQLGGASLTLMPLSLINALTLPNSDPDTK